MASEDSARRALAAMKPEAREPWMRSTLMSSVRDARPPGRALLACICQRIVGQIGLPSPPPTLAAHGQLRRIG